MGEAACWLKCNGEGPVRYATMRAHTCVCACVCVCVCVWLCVHACVRAHVHVHTHHVCAELSRAQ